MRPLLLATLLLSSTLLAGCTEPAPPTRDELGFPVASRLNGVNATDDGNLTLTAGPGLVVGSDANRSIVEVALAPAASTLAFQACAGTCKDVEVPHGSLVADTAVFSLGNASLNADGPEGDSALHFFESGEETGRWLRWSDELDEFQLNDALVADGNLTALENLGSRRIALVPVEGEEQPFVVNTVAPEGHEAILWARGIGQLADGVATIELPILFQAMTDDRRVTVHVTLTSKATGLWVSAKSHRAFTVESVADDGQDATFDWYVMAAREGATYSP